jgi:hypothetical protein
MKSLRDEMEIVNAFELVGTRHAGGVGRTVCMRDVS